ncbi:MAG: bifunctional 4-hydroxy-2-oxoglutarate aldolase/2-dehydro-3-deoxy-phosphogluconate aldolase [Firmicutes bacterium]|jgi:2-dehydro-3-deoxyphosphogluconate aldolase/(4S)-4-hydroxy-2-oxoglutarate aldolase|nr:bifunctional 4-hydroxy-2-oxoglutarate aldolase/2-dehydro-3-deoxy-phosphogluconate aldolase [Bacillota bacterium]
MQKLEILSRIQKVGVVAVVRAETSEEAIKIAESCLAGGVSAIEITFTVPGAHRVIADLRARFGPEELLVGAGTVLDSETARIAMLEGAEFIVSPALDEPTARLCNRYQIPYMPGCITLRDMIEALELGADIIKLFPGSLVGPDFVKAVRGPLPHVSVMPTGGVSLANVEQWIKNGCVAVGVGGQLTKGAKTGDFDLVTKTAREFVTKVQTARKGENK